MGLLFLVFLFNPACNKNTAINILVRISYVLTLLFPRDTFQRSGISSSKGVIFFISVVLPGYFT